jgi:hypothetical protein
VGVITNDWDEQDEDEVVVAVNGVCGADDDDDDGNGGGGGSCCCCPLLASKEDEDESVVVGVVVGIVSKVSNLYVGIKLMGCSLKAAKGVVCCRRSNVSWSYFNNVSKSCFWMASKTNCREVKLSL